MGNHVRPPPDEPTNADPDATDRTELARRALLKLALYVPPAIIGTLAISQDAHAAPPSCGPAFCPPNACAPYPPCKPAAQCAPGQCAPNNCGPTSCPPVQGCGPASCAPRPP